MNGILPGEETTLVFGDRLVRALIRDTRIDHAARAVDATSFSGGQTKVYQGVQRTRITVTFDVIGVESIQETQAKAVAAAIAEAAPGLPGERAIDLEDL